MSKSSSEDRTRAETSPHQRSSSTGPTDAAGNDHDAADTPERLGRYLVVGEVGRGGMGRVLRAYDPKLRREVALKLVKSGGRSPETDARLVHEAQAMARLSHPNLVPVHDVEIDADWLFIVMEYVEGDTLRTWLQTPRTWAQVVDAFVAAGRGLAAAHAAGIVHRDFKPSNAIVGADGRVRVMDFGIARALGTHGVDSLEELALPQELTQAGTVMGTPPYLAPEQHEGAEATVASDQYAFCVALYEALYGERPFVGADVAALGAAKRRGVPDPPPERARDVPRWLHRVVARGLAVQAAERWPTMDDLLAAFARGQARVRTRRVLAAAGGVALAIVAVVASNAWNVRRMSATCERAGQAIAEVWNDDVRAQLRAGLLASETSLAATTADKVMPWLDAQAEAWADARTEACLDADVRRTLDAELLDRALWCLDERRMELDALVHELQAANVETIVRSVRAAAGLSRVQPCRDAALLQRLPPPPTEARAEVEAVRVGLWRARALGATGAHDEALSVAREGLRRAQELGWPPLVAAAGVRVGEALRDTGAYADAESMLEAAYFEGARAGATEDALAAADMLVGLVGSRLARVDEGERWLHHADVMRELLPDPSGLREARRLSDLAALRHAAGAYAEAVTHYRGALDILEAALGPIHPDVAATLGALGRTRYAMGAYAEAAATHERAIEILEHALGPEHPEVAGALGGLANVRYATGDYEQSAALHERAVAVLESTLGPRHPDLAPRLANLANVRYATGRYDEAVSEYQRALGILELAVGPHHPNLAALLVNLANVRYTTGALAEAAALHERALAIYERGLGPDHPDLAMSLANLGNVRYVMGATDEAAQLFERALAIQERALGRDHPMLGFPLMGLAHVALARHRPDEAVRAAERAVHVREAGGVSATDLADAKFVLARALDKAGGPRERAIALVEAARDTYRDAGSAHARSLEDVETWLAGGSAGEKK